MEKNLVMCSAAFLLACVFLQLGCSSSAGSGGEGQAVQGIVYTTGNEPFTRLALLGDDGTRYFLSCPKETEEKLNRLQGRKVRIHFSSRDRGPEGPVLKVVGIDPVLE